MAKKLTRRERESRAARVSAVVNILLSVNPNDDTEVSQVVSQAQEAFMGYVRAVTASMPECPAQAQEELERGAGVFVAHIFSAQERREIGA